MNEHIPYLKGVTFYGTQLFNAATTAYGALVPVQFSETLSLLPENTLRIVRRTCNKGEIQQGLPETPYMQFSNILF